MKYKKIASGRQYNEYCEKHEALVNKDYNKYLDEIELLEILIDEYENREIPYEEFMNPVELLKYLLEEENIPRSKLAKDLGISRQLVTDILRYRRSFSKSVIMKLSEYFHMAPRAFNREYNLEGQNQKQGRSTA